MTETETEMSSRRHLAAVPDEAGASADGVPVGVVWQQDQAQEQQVLGQPAGAHTRQEAPEERGPLMPAEEAAARTGWAPGLGEQTKQALAAGNTYARLAWARRWETSMRYVMDPGLREEMLDAAEESLDEKRRQAAKKAHKAIKDEDKKKAKKDVERLDRRQVSEMEVDARCLRARGMRLATQCAVPATVILGPVLMAAGGMWWALAAWPAAWGWLAMQGRALLGQPRAQAEEVPTAPVTGGQEQARVAAPATPAPGAERVVGATAAENVLLARLEHKYWSKHAKKRGLDDLVPGAPTLGVSGVSVPLHLGGTWTPAKVRAATDRIRAMLAVPEGAGVQVAPAATGEGVVLRMRTRTPDVDTAWRPERGEIALVPETGAGVELSPYGHRLVAGVTGAGKSTAMRASMVRAVLDPAAALVFVDPKGQEAGLWEHCARTVKGAGSSGYERLYAVICELEDELSWRQEHAEGTDWIPTQEYPELVIAIDEGAALVRMSKQKEYKDVLAKVEYLVSQGRAGAMWVHWATQYPTKADGIPAQVTENITTRLALNTGSSQADRVVFGEQATATGWTPSELDMPGWAMLRTGPRDVPEHLAMVYMRDEQVRALPEREPWHHDPEAGAPVEEAVLAGDDSGGQEGMPEALAVALQICQNLPGVRSGQIAEAMGTWDILQIQNELRDAGVKAGRYSDPEEGQTRGYRREDLQAAAGDFQ